MEKGENMVQAYCLEEICKALDYSLEQELLYTLTPLQGSGKK